MSLTNRTFGIELEIIVPSGVTSAMIIAKLAESSVACAYENYNHSTRRHWKLVSDISVRASTRGWGIELVSPVLSGEAGIEEVRKVCAALVALHIGANRTCGFHVHHGASDFKTRHFEHLFSLYRNSEKAIDALMPLSRRDDLNQFCRSLKAKSTQTLMVDRYHKLNLCSFARHGTVEFRHHAGTVNAEKVVSWILFTQRMVERAKRKVNSADHDYTWFDVKQLLGLVHTSDEKLLATARFYDTRRNQLAAPVVRVPAAPVVPTTAQVA